jgi:hypothetical protein
LPTNDRFWLGDPEITSNMVEHQLPDLTIS